MRADHDDHCVECGDETKAGDKVHWKRGEGVRCWGCGPFPVGEPSGSATGMEDAPGYVRVLGKKIDALESRVQELDLAVGQAQQVMFRLSEWAVKLSAELDIEPPDLLGESP